MKALERGLLAIFEAGRFDLGAHLIELGREPRDIPGHRLGVEATRRIPLARGQPLRVDVAGCNLDQEHPGDQALPCGSLSPVARIRARSA